MIATHKLHVSSHRLAVARSWLDTHRSDLAGMPDDSRLVAAVGLLICDDSGHFSERELASALTDSRVISAANRLISEVIS